MMATHLWFFMALGASILWGVGYALSGKVMELGISPTFYILFSTMITAPLLLIISAMKGGIRDNIGLLMADKSLLLYLVISALTTVMGYFLIMHSIAYKNATLASLIEISYPFFTLAFAWLFFRDSHLNWTTFSGALLIFSGITVIFLKG